MKLSIDHHKIIDSPYCSSNSFCFLSDDRQQISQISQELINGNPTCFLISGYRGSGKTSFIKMVEEQVILSDDVIFAHINFSRLESRTNILRKLIRGIFLALQNTDVGKKLKASHKLFYEEIGTLYERTFYEVNYLNSSKDIKSEITTLKTSVDLRNILWKLVFGGVVEFCLGVNFSYDFLSLQNQNLNIFFIVLVSLFLIFQSVSLTYKLNVELVKTDEELRKSLYDDEIAEHHLTEVLRGLRAREIKVVFVLDELDKLNDDSHTEGLISEMKPLMLSGLASFIVVSGQYLYYKFRNAQIADDPVMLSTFSRLIHIPLLPTSTFENLFYFILKNPKEAEKENLKYFIDSLVLRSNRLPRRFYNLVRQKLVWNGDVSLLEISKTDLPFYKTDSKILTLIDQIEENEISKNDMGIRDFYYSQLHIWIHKMQLKAGFFAKDSIFNFAEDYSKSYPTSYIYGTEDLLNKLLSGLVNIKLLETKLSTDDPLVTLYRWTKAAALNPNDRVDDELQVASHFLKSFIDFEKFIFKIYTNIFSQKESLPSIRMMLHEIIDVGILDERWGQNSKLNNIIELRNKLVHGKALTQSDLDIAQDYRLTLLSFRFELIESYTFYVIKNFISKFNYSVEKRRDHSDFIAISSDIKKPDIIFDIKFSNNFSNTRSDALKSVIENLRSRDLFTYKRNVAAFFYFARSEYTRFEMSRKMFAELIEKNHELEGRVFPIFFSYEEIDKADIEREVERIIFRIISDQ